MPAHASHSLQCLAQGVQEQTHHCLRLHNASTCITAAAVLCHAGQTLTLMTYQLERCSSPMF
jgi:hypothetical protein